MYRVRAGSRRASPAGPVRPAQHTYLGLLRGINVGGRNKVPMAELRQLMAELGWVGVRSHLQSGNIVFRTADRAPGPKLEVAIAQRFGFEVPCLILTRDELEQVVEACPLPTLELEPSKVLVLFIRETPKRTHFESVDRAAVAPDEFHHVGKAVYCYFPNGMGRSRLGDVLAAVPPALTMTGRNWRTVQRLLELTDEARPET